MALIRNIVPLYLVILRSVRDDSQNEGLEKGWAAAAQIKSECVSGETGANFE